MNILKLYKILNEGSPSIFAEEEMVDEMAMIVGNLDTAIRDVVDANPNLQGNELKRVIRSDADVRNALAGDKLHDNQLNRFIDKIRSGKSPRPEPGAEPEPAPGAEPTHGTHDSPLPSQASKISPQVRMAILGKLDAGASPEELADRYGLEVDDITAMQSMSAAEDEGDVKDIEGLRTGDNEREYKHIEVPTPEQSSRSVDAEVLAKAERAFYINPKADKEQVMNNLKVWAAKRNDRTDITQTKHPLRGASDEQVTDALNKVAKKLGAQKVAAGKRLGAQSLGGNELGGDDGAKEYRDLDKDFAHEESFASFSNTLSEHMKTLKSTSTVRYPNQVKFSEEFINKLVEEYTNHTAIREGQGVIRNIEEKMLKALRMHLHEISKAKKLNEEPQFSKGKLPSDEYTSKDKLKKPKKDPKYDFKNRPGTYGYDRTKPIEENDRIERRGSSMVSPDNIYINEDPVNFVEFSPLNNEELGEVNAEQSATVKRKFGAKAQIHSGAETGDGSDGVYSKIAVNGKLVATILSGYEYGGTDIYHYINSMDTGIERRGSSPITKSDSKYLKSLKTR